MKSTREQFEEIWPVPEGMEWLSHVGRYVQITGKWLPMGAAQAYIGSLLDEIGMSIALEHYAGPGNITMEDFRYILERAQ